MRIIIITILALILSVGANSQNFSKFYVEQKKEAFNIYDAKHKKDLQSQIWNWERALGMVHGVDYSNVESLSFLGLRTSSSLTPKQYEQETSKRLTDAHKHVLIKRLLSSSNLPLGEINDSTLEKYVMLAGSPADNLQLWLNRYDSHLGTNGKIIGKNSPEISQLLDSIEIDPSKRLPSIVFDALSELQGKFKSVEDFRLALKKGTGKFISASDANFLWNQINDSVVFKMGMVKRAQIIFRKVGLYTRTLDDKFGRNTLESYRSLSDLLIKDFNIQDLASGYDKIMLIQDISESKNTDIEKKRDADLWTKIVATHGNKARRVTYGVRGREDHFMVIMMAILKFPEGNNAIILSTDELNHSEFTSEELKFIQVMAKVRNIDIFIKFNIPKGFININLQNWKKLKALNKNGSKNEAEFIKSVM